MFNIRKSLFETNSSSTHSISLARPQPIKQDDIPRNTAIYLKPYAEPSCGYDDDTAEFYVYRTQMAKLRYIVHVIVSILYSDVPDKYLTEFKDRIDDWRNKPTVEEKEKYAEHFFAISQFKWLFDMLNEKTGAILHITYDVEEDFPFWTQVFDDNSSLLEVIEFTEESWNDEKTFKDKMSELIFNNEIVIYDKNIPYSCSDETNIKEF